VFRLEQVFEAIGQKVRGKHCDGIAGIIEEGKSIMEEDFDDSTMDACLIAAGQRAEHYEMAAYGTLVAWAKVLGHDDAADLLEQTLEESGRPDQGFRRCVPICTDTWPRVPHAVREGSLDTHRSLQWIRLRCLSSSLWCWRSAAADSSTDGESDSQMSQDSTFRGSTCPTTRFHPS
jgi:hypothetical protein